jgi:DNA-directed RNA polymerase specialized sigma24 family protein
VARLNREWSWLSEQAPDWSCPWGASLGQVLAAVPDRPDAVLGHLIEACQAGHDRAGRVVVQAFLGKLVRLSRSDSRLQPDDLVAALWIRLARYPLDRRPAKIAANLVLDTRKDVLAERRELACLNAPPAPDRLTAGAVLEAALSLELVSEPTARIVATVYADGLTSAKAAARHATSPAAVRWRCSDAVRRLRRHRAALVELCVA